MDTKYKSVPKQYKTKRNPRTSNRNQYQSNGNKYTYPDVNYDYKIVPWEAFMDNKYTGYTTIRSSFIPYTIINGENYWLLGSFVDFPNDILADFGGSCIVWDPPRQYAQGKHQHRNYQHQFGCAMLELNEESKRLLVQPVLKSLGTNKPTVYLGYDNKNKTHVWFVKVFLPYEEIQNIPNDFVNTPLVINEKLGPLAFYKESDILNKKHRTSKNLTDFVDYLRK